MKKLITLMVFFAAIAGVQAQTSYTVSNVFCDTAFVGGTNVTLNDDQYTHPIAIGFPFCFYGVTYDSLLIGSNTGISFNLSYSGGFKPFSVPTLGAAQLPSQVYNGIHSPMQDLNPATGGSISYHVEGTPPNRVFVVEYNQVPYFGQPTHRYSGKVKLFETSNVIEQHLMDRAWGNMSAMLGIIPASTNATDSPVFPQNFWGNWTAHLQAIRYVPFGPCSASTDFNIISGNIFFDMNLDCVDNGTDFPLGGQLVTANAGASYTFTDQFGNYALVVDTGAYSIEHTPSNIMSINCPTTAYTHTFATYGNIVTGDNFADTARQCVNVNVDIGSNWQRLCRNNQIHVHYSNSGTIPSAATTVSVTIPAPAIFVSSNPAPTSVAGNVYTFAVPALLPNQSGNISIVDSIDCTAAMGDSLLFTATLGAIGVEECDSTGNQAFDYTHVVASWDPNDMMAQSQTPTHGYVMAETIDETDQINYLIRFQNLGTAPAGNVTVVTELPAELAAATVVPGASSHNYQFYRYGNELRFIYNDIELPFSSMDEPGSHGFIRFRVQQTAGNLPGSSIITNANVYFDGNAPVLTNDVVLTLAVTGIEQPTMNGVQIAPNPVKDAFTLNYPEFTTGKDAQLTICDPAGRVVRQVAVNSTYQSVNVANLAAGVYFVRLQTVDGTVGMTRIVKQ